MEDVAYFNIEKLMPNWIDGFYLFDVASEEVGKVKQGS